MEELYLGLRPSQSDQALEGGGVASVQNVTCAVAPGASLTRRRRLNIGSRTAPAVLERGCPSITETGVRIERPRPRKRARSVSNCTPENTSPSETTRCAAHTCGSSGDPRRRVARTAPISATNSVCTNKFENAGCAASAASGANTISAYEVNSISRVRFPEFVRVTRRTSASSSGETATSSLVVMVPSSLEISTRSSKKDAS